MARTTSNPLVMQSFHGISGGINQAVPPQEIPDTMAVWLQDVLLDKAGEIRQRGPLEATGDVSATISDKAQGLVSVIAPDGTVRIATLSGTSTPKLNLLSSDFSAVVSENWGSEDWSSKPPIYQARATFDGGMLIGTAEDVSTFGSLGLWLGATSADYSTGTVSVTRGSKAVTFSGSAGTISNHMEAGMFLFSTSGSQRTLLGVIDSITGTSTLNLVDGSLATASSANYIVTSVRGISARCGAGRITTSGSSGDSNVYGAATKFRMMQTLGETWDLYRASDLTWVGTVSGFVSDTQLTLTTNAAIGMSNEAYVAIRLAPSDNFSVTQTKGVGSLGMLTTSYQGREFYSFGTRVWFSELFDSEAVDMSPADGDFFDVTSQVGGSTPIMAIVGLQNAMAILKEQELFALYGTDTSNFQIRKIADVGAVSPMSVVQYKTGVIFAGRNGIYNFDGTAVQELSLAIGPAFRDAMVDFDSTTDRAYAATFRNHIILSLSAFAPTYQPQRGSQGTTITDGTLVQNLDTGAITFWTNVQFQGWVTLPASSGFNAWLIENDSSDHTQFSSAVDLWTGSGPDTITCKGQSLGPSFYAETKLYDARDPERLKNWRQISVHYKLAGDSLTMDVIQGLSGVGSTTNQVWLRQDDFSNKRIKFMSRNTHVGFRLYPTNNTASEVVIGPFALGFKLQRVGRV